MKNLNIHIGTTAFLCLILSACSAGIKQKDLIGRWNYVSYEYPNQPANKPLANISAQKPYIVFGGDAQCKIVSSGKILSEGSYYLDKHIIRYTEDLAGGQKRPIPFLIKSLTDKELVFQTMDSDVKVITASKAN
ncbi:MAG TPA: hypothetical protein VF273_10720 [Pelobium sp.]